MRLNSRPAAHWIDRLLSHWLLAAVIILVAAALTIPQLDSYGLGMDANYSFVYSGLNSSAPISTADVLHILVEHTPDHTPLYYLLVNWWAKLAGNSLAAARLISLYCGLITLALTWRMAQEFIAPVAGLFAIVVLVSNAYFAFQYAHLRNYTMMTMFGALALWLYLRLITAQRTPGLRDYLTLTLATYAMIMTHPFTLALYATIGMYHLLAVRKDRRWLPVSAAAVLSVALALPQFAVLFTDGLRHARTIFAETPNLPAILNAWAMTFCNGAPELLLLSSVGAWLGWLRGQLPRSPFILLLPIMLLTIVAVAIVTMGLSESRLRYLLFGLPIVACFASTGLYAFYLIRRWLAALALLWLAAGIAFANAGDWDTYLQNRLWSYNHPPWHLVSRLLLRTLDEPQNAVVLTSGVSHWSLRHMAISNAWQRQFWFERHGIEVFKYEPVATAKMLAERQLFQQNYALVYQTGKTDPAKVTSIDALLKDFGYQLCSEEQLPNRTIVRTYNWTSLSRCVNQPATFANAVGKLQFFGARLDDGRLFLSSEWQPRHLSDSFNISFQLLDADWNSHTQLDLSADHAVQLRQFVIDIADVPPGNYWLMAIVYNAQTGERQVWQGNEGWIPEMQRLAEIVIPAASEDAP